MLKIISKHEQKIMKDKPIFSICISPDDTIVAHQDALVLLYCTVDHHLIYLTTDSFLCLWPRCLLCIHWAVTKLLTVCAWTFQVKGLRHNMAFQAVGDLLTLKKETFFIPKNVSDR